MKALEATFPVVNSSGVDTLEQARLELQQKRPDPRFTQILIRVALNAPERQIPEWTASLGESSEHKTSKTVLSSEELRALSGDETANKGLWIPVQAEQVERLALSALRYTATQRNELARWQSASPYELDEHTKTSLVGFGYTHHKTAWAISGRTVIRENDYSVDGIFMAGAAGMVRLRQHKRKRNLFVNFTNLLT